MDAEQVLVATEPTNRQNRRQQLSDVRVKPRSNLYYASRRFLRQRLAVVGLVITFILMIIGIGAPIFAPAHYAEADLMSANQFPNRDHWFGTDAIGHDYLSRIIYGLRTSLLVGFGAVLISSLIGMPLGLLAGMRGGWADFLVLRIVEIMTALPGILFAIFMVSVVGGGVRNVVLVIGLVSWISICRLTRAQILTLREQEYITAARSIGLDDLKIALRYILPNALAPLIVSITLAIPLAIFAEAGLSFLGIGINEPTPSLGKMVADNSGSTIRVYWHLAFFPTVTIALAMPGFTFLGDGLRDALDPRQN